MVVYDAGLDALQLNMEEESSNAVIAGIPVTIFNQFNSEIIQTMLETQRTILEGNWKVRVAEEGRIKQESEDSAKVRVAEEERIAKVRVAEEERKKQESIDSTQIRLAELDIERQRLTMLQHGNASKDNVSSEVDPEQRPGKRSAPANPASRRTRARRDGAQDLTAAVVKRLADIIGFLLRQGV